MIKALKYLLKPLIEFLDDHEEGEKIYQYLYFTRSGVENEVEAAIVQGHHNITVVGKPGMGKTSLMHYMFIELKRKTNLYPIILDYRSLTPKKPEALLTLFVKDARKYFTEIGHPINHITEETTLSNCADHSLIVQRHLSAIPKSQLKKKMVLFLDDLDYAENDYMTILKDYFLPYAQTDKANLILSVRPPLMNSLKRFDHLRQYYHSFPRVITIPEDDIEFILNNRLKSILELEEKENQDKGFFGKSITIGKFLKAFREKSIDEIIIKKLRDEDNDFTSATFKLPFDSNFYSKIKNITFSNLRVIEELLPDIIDWEKSNPTNSINDNFYEPFITIAIRKSHIILDLVSDRTRDNKTKYNDNAIIQNVLEYFKFEEAVNDYFYKEMADYGISRLDADKAIEMLVRTPYSLIVPDFVYLKDHNEVNTIIQHYKINKKGIQFIENILRNNLYYSLENELGNMYKKSNRSYYDDRLKREGKSINK